MRSVVVFPQPDGPSSVANAPRGISNEMSSTAIVSPNVFVTCSRLRCTVPSPPAVRSGRLRTGRSERDPPAREQCHDAERDYGHADVGDGERRGGPEVEVAHVLVDAYRREGRFR